ncbi:MAG: heavy-metal-associated domain-containing protein, partial [Nitrososphaerales archaeon]
GRAQQLRRAADRLDGVLRVDINYISDTATIEYDADRLTLAQVESIHHDEPRSTPPGVVAEPRGNSSRGPVQTNRYIQGKRGKGEINRNSRRRGRYSRTQRGRLGE